MKKVKKIEKEEIVSLFRKNKENILNILIKNHEFEDVKVLKVHEDFLIVKDTWIKEDSRRIDIPETDLIEYMSEFKYLYKIFDKLGFKKDCLNSVDNYDERILELSKQIAGMKYNIEDYEFRITDGNFEENDLYYIVCWIEKEYLEKNKKESNISFKCASEYHGASFILEMSKYPKFDHILYRDWMDEEDYIYACYLTYLYTRNLDRLNN